MASSTTYYISCRYFKLLISSIKRPKSPRPLRQLMEKGAVDELSNLKDIIMKDIHIAGRFRGHRSCDKIAQCLIPSDISPTWKNAVAVVMEIVYLIKFQFA